MMILRLIGLLLASSALVIPAGWEAGSQRSLGGLPEGVRAWEQEFTHASARVLVTGVSFRPEPGGFRVSDNPPGSTKRLAEAAAAQGAIAGCNASYFHKDGRPLGLVVQDGQVLHGQERAKLLSGILAFRNGQLELVRSVNFRLDKCVEHAVQAGPWLVEKTRPVDGLEDTRRARRTIVATDGRGIWAFVALSPATLADAAQILSQPGTLPQGGRVRDALNLDGGSSTALWAGAAGISIPELGTVRNFLLLLSPEDR